MICLAGARSGGVGSRTDLKFWQASALTLTLTLTLTLIFQPHTLTRLLSVKVINFYTKNNKV
jgi:hypothetical protein